MVDRWRQVRPGLYRRLDGWQVMVGDGSDLRPFIVARPDGSPLYGKGRRLRRWAYSMFARAAVDKEHPYEPTL